MNHVELPVIPVNLKEELLKIVLHNPPLYPHWSTTIVWRHNRWDPMSNAPRRGYPILMVRARDVKGRILEPMHYACGDGDGLMPSFDGWFVPSGNGFVEVTPVEWQPLHGTYD